MPQIPRLSYWENDIISTEGEQHMGLFVLRDSAGSAAFQSVRCVAMCCYSTMLVDHPNYRGKKPQCKASRRLIALTETTPSASLFLAHHSHTARRVLVVISATDFALAGNVCMVFEHAVKLSVAPAPIDARIYMCDYDEEERGQLPSVPPGCPVTEQGPVKAGLATGRFATLPFLAPVSELQVGSDAMQALFERLGEPIVLDLEEVRNHCLKFNALFGFVSLFLVNSKQTIQTTIHHGTRGTYPTLAHRHITACFA